MNKQQKEAVSQFYELLDRGAKEIGLKIPKSQYPQIEIGDEPSYDPLDNKLILPEEYINSGRIIGEYLGHVLRELSNRKRTRNLQRVRYSTALLTHLGFKPKISHSKEREQRDIEVDEFFGYLGRILAEEITQPEDNLNFRQKTPYKMREQHHKAYEYAKSLNPEEIDYKTLFQMPNKEVRRIYFRKPKSGLEQTLKLILPITVILTLILIAKNITGYVIQQNSEQSPWLPIILIIFLLILLHKNLNKQSKTL